MSTSVLHRPRPPARKKLKFNYLGTGQGNGQFEREEARNSKRIKRRAPSPPRNLDQIQQTQLAISDQRKSFTQQMLSNKVDKKYKFALGILFFLRTLMCQVMKGLAEVWQGMRSHQAGPDPHQLLLIKQT